ncbi:MAG TPA: FeoB small GTPase domain-containing protein, partial [Candidatus Ozemobacteraceae bacterium]|nr:FeoB small GTPase domain-containing protein [Candidatus Ozemobacteraceae bacterium]
MTTISSSRHQQRKAADLPLQVYLIGFPNSGKTALFNALTGSTEEVGNWPGVTQSVVGRRIIHESDTLDVFDLPPCEDLLHAPVHLDQLLSEQPSDNRKVFIQVIDITRIQEQIAITLDLLTLGFQPLPVLSFCDQVGLEEADKRADEIKRLLGIPVLALSPYRTERFPQFLDVVAHTPYRSLQPQTTAFLQSVQPPQQLAQANWIATKPGDRYKAVRHELAQADDGRG